MRHARKIQFVYFLLFIFFGGNLFSDPARTHVFSSTPPSTPDIPQTETCNSIVEQNCYETCCNNDIFFIGGFLLWRPNQPGMAFCYVTEEQNLFSPNMLIAEQGSDWSTGFRVGTGYFLKSTPFDLTFFWTAFNHTSLSQVSGPFIIGTQMLNPGGNFPVGGSLANLGGASSRWILKTDFVELVLGYRQQFDGRFTFHPYFGGEWGWINQLQKISYINFNAGNPENFNAFIKSKNAFKGIGPKVGMDGRLSIVGGFAVFSDLSVSLLYGRTHNPTSLVLNGETAGFGFPDLLFEYSQRKRVIPKAAIKVGIDGKWCFKECAWLAISAAYEAQYIWGVWRNQNSPTQNIFIPEAGYSNLSLSGLTADARMGIDF